MVQSKENVNPKYVGIFKFLPPPPQTKFEFGVPAPPPRKKLENRFLAKNNKVTKKSKFFGNVQKWPELIYHSPKCIYFKTRTSIMNIFSSVKFFPLGLSRF